MILKEHDVNDHQTSQQEDRATYTSGDTGCAESASVVAAAADWAPPEHSAFWNFIALDQHTRYIWDGLGDNFKLPGL